MHNAVCPPEPGVPAITQRHPSGRHFPQIPAPTIVPDRILRITGRHGPDLMRPATGVLGGLRPIFGIAGPVVIDPASGPGAREAALVTRLSPGDREMGVARSGLRAAQGGVAAALARPAGDRAPARASAA